MSFPCSLLLPFLFSSWRLGGQEHGGPHRNSRAPLGGDGIISCMRRRKTGCCCHDAVGSVCRRINRLVAGMYSYMLDSFWMSAPLQRSSSSVRSFKISLRLAIQALLYFFVSAFAALSTILLHTQSHPLPFCCHIPNLRSIEKASLLHGWRLA